MCGFQNNMITPPRNRYLQDFVFVRFQFNFPQIIFMFCNIKNQIMYGVRNLDMSIRFSLKSRPSEGIPRPEMSQIKAEISLHTNLKLIFHKNVGWQGYQWIP